jgi:hypothetical protein
MGVRIIVRSSTGGMTISLFPGARSGIKGIIVDLSPVWDVLGAALWPVKRR